MQIEIVQGHEPPANPDGITVVIDVIRAFTTAYYALAGGVETIWPVSTPAEAFALQERIATAVLAGEIDALPIAGFDMGNSPFEVTRNPPRVKDMIMRTTNGIRATLNARHSRHVLVAGLVNAEATVSALRRLRNVEDEPVVLVASHPTGDEDVACAEYMRHLMGGPGINLEDAIERVRHCYAAQKFLYRAHPRLHPEDIHLCADSHGDRAFAMGVTFSRDPFITRLN